MHTVGFSRYDAVRLKLGLRKRRIIVALEQLSLGLATRKPKRADLGQHGCPQLTVLWAALIRHYFPDRTDLLEYSLHWSLRRQKRTLASCNIVRHKVLVAQELKHPDYERFLPALLYHELCHAVLGLSIRSNGKTPWHGREFKALECRHPEIEHLNNWIKTGGWRQAVRRHRGRSSAQARITKVRRPRRARKTFFARVFEKLGMR